MFKKSSRMLTLAMVASVGILTPAALVAPAGAHSPAADDPSVITEWNAMAQTIIAEPMPPTPIPTHGLYFGFVSIAMHDAVVAVKGGYEPYNDVRRRAHRGASAEVAAATAAYKVLLKYYPDDAATLHAFYKSNLADVPQNRAYARGVRVGNAAAAALIRDRKNDGRTNVVTYDVPPGPGVWQPTPPLGFVAINMGFIKPLALKSASQFDLDGPPALTSKRYAKEFKEVKRYGEAGSDALSAADQATATFWSVNVFAQFNAALRDAVTRRGYDISESARAFAVMNTSVADTQIACWREKLEHPFWRPITAIRQAGTDGNPRTKADPAWTPRVDTPPYPDYPSGHACMTGATTNALSYLFGKRQLDINVPANPFVENSPTRHYDSARKLDKETMNARVWLGIHFRTAVVDGNRLGHKVSNWIVNRYFEPLR
jgi:PAP2 superfamily